MSVLDMERLAQRTAPIDIRGLSDDAGSWKTKPKRERNGRSCRSERPEISLPETWIVPLVGCCRPTVVRPTVDLPEPDSPTRPSTSPLRTSSDTWSTARKGGWPEAAGELDDEVVDLEHDQLVSSSTSPGPLLAAQVRHGVEQCARVGVLRLGEQLAGGSLLDDVAAIHHDDAVGHVGDDAHVVRDQHDAVPSRSRSDAGARGSRPGP